MKTFVSIIVSIAIITTFVFSNIMLVTEANVVGIEGIYTLVEHNGDIFVIENRPDIINNVTVVFYTPHPNPESWEIIYIKERQ